MKKVFALASHIIAQSFVNAAEIIENTYTEEYKDKAIDAVEEVVDAYQESDLPKIINESGVLFQQMSNHINQWMESFREDLDTRLTAKFNGQKFDVK